MLHVSMVAAEGAVLVKQGNSTVVIPNGMFPGILNSLKGVNQRSLEGCPLEISFGDTAPMSIPSEIRRCNETSQEPPLGLKTPAA